MWETSLSGSVSLADLEGDGDATQSVSDSRDGGLSDSESVHRGREIVRVIGGVGEMRHVI